MALGELQDEVPGMPDQATTGLEQPLLEARQGPALDGERQGKPTQEVAEVVGDDPEEESDLVGPEPMAGEPGPVGGFLALLDPLRRRPALIVEMDDGSVRSGQSGNDEAHPREEFPEVVLDLGDHLPRSVPRRGLILEASIPYQWGIAGSAPGPSEQVLDRPLQHPISREPDG